MDLKRNHAARFEGRLFADAGGLCLVVEVDNAAGTGRVSRRVDGESQVVEMPLAELGERISSSSNLQLDNIGRSDLSRRILRKRDGWYFSAREGLKGPFPSHEEAESELRAHVLSTQS